MNWDDSLVRLFSHIKARTPIAHSLPHLHQSKTRANTYHKLRSTWLSQLPENRRQYAKKAIERIMQQFYGEKEERIQSIVNVVLDALEHDEYWQVLREIERTSKSEVQLFAESLGNFGLVEIALIGRQAQSRLRFLDFLDKLAANAEHT